MSVAVVAALVALWVLLETSEDPKPAGDPAASADESKTPAASTSANTASTAPTPRPRPALTVPRPELVDAGPTLSADQLRRLRKRGGTQRLRKHARHHYDGGRYAKSIEESMRLLVNFPDMDDVRAVVVAANCALGDAASAIRHFQKLTERRYVDEATERCADFGVQL